jgi:sugar/nucleoside kinase (ribokinase family)
LHWNYAKPNTGIVQKTAAYLARRMDRDAPEALKFAAALVSIKMETPGPFVGTLDDVLARMQ